MKNGKHTCRILKEIRRSIAEANDIKYTIEECQYKGECRGTCPKCEAEVRYLEQQLSVRQYAGKAISLVGLSLSVAALSTQLTSCGTTALQNNTTLASPSTTPMTKHPIDTTKFPSINPSTDKEPIKQKKETEVGDLLLKPDTTYELAGLMPAPDTTYELEGLMLPLEDDLRDFEIKTFTKKEETVEEDVPVVTAEEMPTFNGRDINGFREWCDENLVYPSIAIDSGIQGRVFLSFVVERDGCVADVRIMRGVNHELDTAAKKVVESSPKWSPGRDRGKPVRFLYNMPVDFLLVK